MLPILGSPNRVTPKILSAAKEAFAPLFAATVKPRLAVLIGGASKTHGRMGPHEATALTRALKALSTEHYLMISTSRRTSPLLAEQLRQAFANVESYLWDWRGANPYFGLLAWADAFLVTADSVNMICEAGSVGKPVHVFPLPGARPKSEVFHRAVAARGVTRPFRGVIEHWSYAPLDETGRAVSAVEALLAGDVQCIRRR